MHPGTTTLFNYVFPIQRTGAPVFRKLSAIKTPYKDNRMEHHSLLDSSINRNVQPLQSFAMTSTMQNPSIVLYGAGKAKMEDKPIPAVLEGHDVLVKIEFVGVCGSDVSVAPSSHTLQNEHKSNPRRYISGKTAE